MKTSLLYIGILSALLIASSSSFAKPPKGSSSVEAIARSLRGYRNESAENQARVFEMITSTRRNNPSFFDKPDLSLVDVYKEYFRLVRTGQVSSNPVRVLDALMHVTSTPSISETTAQAIIGVLQSKLATPLSQAKLDTLRRVITSSQKPEVGESLQKLAEKVEENSEGIRSEDIQTVMEFSINTSQITRNSTEGNTPTPENIVLDLAKHGYDMVTWHAQPRGEAMDLISKFNRRVDENGISGAMNGALSERGYRLVADIHKRLRELRDKCR